MKTVSHCIWHFKIWTNQNRLLTHGVRQGHMHHEALIKIIILKQLLAVDNDMLYKGDCM